MWLDMRFLCWLDHYSTQVCERLQRRSLFLPMRFVPDLVAASGYLRRNLPEVPYCGIALILNYLLKKTRF